MEQPVPEPAAFLPQACAKDLELRRKVQSLLDQQADSFHRHAQKAKKRRPLKFLKVFAARPHFSIEGSKGGLHA